MTLNKKDRESCVNLLSQCELFQKLSEQRLKLLASRMELRMLDKNERFIFQDDPVDSFYLLESGKIQRKYIDPNDGRAHNVEFAIKARSINSMRIVSGQPSHSTVKCVSDSCKLYQMKRETFLNLLQENPDLSVGMIEGLCEEIKVASKKYRTPLLEQQNKDEVNIPAVAIAAGIESYYRSALNAMLNARLTGVKSDLFPNMHIQVPTRIAYITGFKTLRAYLDRNVEPESYSNPDAVRVGMTISPGVLMTPISSILEASNAGHMNKESMATRWMRGVVPRCAREIIFGIGLNQMSDFFEERYQPYFEKNPGKSHILANALGSMSAGVVSGYLSHVPHNLSTYKLLEPHRSYGELYKMFVDKSVPPMIESAVAHWPSTAKNVTRTVFATVFPRGLVVRTTQIVGSFIILNGIINFLQLREHNKIKKILGTSSTPYGGQ